MFPGEIISAPPVGVRVIVLPKKRLHLVSRVPIGLEWEVAPVGTKLFRTASIAVSVISIIVVP